MIKIPRTELGYSSQKPIRISVKGKGKKGTAQHINFEVEEEEKSEPVSRSSVFDRLGTSAPRESIFNRLSISLPTKEPHVHANQHLIGLGLRGAQLTPRNPRRGKAVYKREMASKPTALSLRA